MSVVRLVDHWPIAETDASNIDQRSKYEQRVMTLVDGCTLKQLGSTTDSKEHLRMPLAV